VPGEHARTLKSLFRKGEVEMTWLIARSRGMVASINARAIQAAVMMNQAARPTSSSG